MNEIIILMSTDTLSLFFKLLRLGIGTEKANGDCLIGFRSLYAEDVAEVWSEIFELGVKQGVAAILLDGLQQLNELQAVSSGAMLSRAELMKWYAHTMKVEQTHIRQRTVISQLAKFYASHDIRMMLLKGYGLSLLYPKPERRPCGDIDIWLYGEQEWADRLLYEEKGIVIDGGHHHHTMFRVGGVMVENHYDFFNIHAHLSSRDIERELHRLAEQEGEKIVVNGEVVYLPPVDFNALFLLRHAGEHFAAAEIALRHVVDWAMFVCRYHKEMDWEWLYSFVRRQNMHRFLHCLNAICVDYLGVSEALFPELERDKELEERVMQDILNPSFYDKSSLKSNILNSFIYRFRRWWANRWKHHMVYREGLLQTFLVQIRSHLMRPGEWK